MTWTSDRKKQFRQALQDVYRSYGALSLFVAEEVGENLEAIAGAGNLTGAAFELIDWAESKGRLEELYAAFCSENPKHGFAAQSGGGNAPGNSAAMGQSGGRTISTRGGDYREIRNQGQYAEGNIDNRRSQRGINSNDSSTVNIGTVIQNFGASSGGPSSSEPSPSSAGQEGDRYVSHESIERECRSRLMEDGALVRIKAPHQMGKTELAVRLCRFAGTQDYDCVVIDFQAVQAQQLAELDRFWRWFCQTIADELDIDTPLDNHWNTELLGSNSSCEKYLQKAILRQTDEAVLLILENVDRLFEVETLTIADEVFRLVRAFHEKAKTSKPWRKLRQVFTYSTEPTAELNSAMQNRSPFNVGTVIELPQLSSEQVMRLAGQFGVPLTPADGQELMKNFGGHPALMQMGFRQLGRSPGLSVGDLYAEAQKPMGAYSGHLDALETRLKSCGQLATMQLVARSPEPVAIEKDAACALYRLGLIDWEMGYARVMPRCRLYRDRFG
ncbi:MAG: AAA-like domain-containing protein [Cyanobacteria bacterium P01_C01_bin.89]